MKVRHYAVQAELIAKALQTGAVHRVRVVDGLPRDARVRGAFTDNHGQIILVVESETFPNVRPQFAPPYCNMMFETIPLGRDDVS